MHTETHSQNVILLLLLLLHTHAHTHTHTHTHARTHIHTPRLHHTRSFHVGHGTFRDFGREAADQAQGGKHSGVFSGSEGKKGDKVSKCVRCWFVCRVG